MRIGRKQQKEFYDIIVKDIETKGFCLVYAFLESSNKNGGYRFSFCNGKPQSDDWISSGFVPKTTSSRNTWKSCYNALVTLFPKNDIKKYDAKSLSTLKTTEWKYTHERLRYVFFISRKGTCEFREVNSLDSFLKQIIDDNLNLLEEEHINTYYRGQLGHWDLNPSLFREKEWVKQETALNAHIVCDRPNDFQDCKSSFDKLVRLKHYNQPSRLMDLTSNPLIALFFACDSMVENPSQGIGIVISAYTKEGTEKISVLSDTVTMLTALTNSKRSDKINSIKCVCSQDKIIPTRLYDDSSCKDCLKKYERDKKEPDCFVGKEAEKKAVTEYLNEISHQAKKESGSELYWDDLCYGELNQCVLVKPPLNTNRIIQQQGCFIMCGLNPNAFDTVPQSYYEYFKPKTEKRVFYYIVPKKLDKILKELKVLGIDKYYIYPDLEKDIEVRKELIKNNGKGKEE